MMNTITTYSSDDNSHNNNNGDNDTACALDSTEELEGNGYLKL